MDPNYWMIQDILLASKVFGPCSEAVTCRSVLSSFWRPTSLEDDLFYLLSLVQSSSTCSRIEVSRDISLVMVLMA